MAAENVPTNAIYDMTMEELEEIFEVNTDEETYETDSDFNFADIQIQIQHFGFSDLEGISALQFDSTTFQFSELDDLIAERTNQIQRVKDEIMELDRTNSFGTLKDLTHQYNREK